MCVTTLSSKGLRSNPGALLSAEHISTFGSRTYGGRTALQSCRESKEENSEGGPGSTGYGNEERRLGAAQAKGHWENSLVGEGKERVAQKDTEGQKYVL